MNVYLRKVELADFDIFKKYADDEEIHRYNTYDIYKKAKEIGFDAFLSDKNETRYAICLRNTGEIIGDIGERKIPGSTDIKFGLMIFRKDLWNKGYGSEAIILLLEMLKARGTKKVVLDVDKQNQSALHVYNKLGFVVDGESAKVSYVDSVVIFVTLQMLASSFIKTAYYLRNI